MKAKDLMTTEVVTATPETTLASIAALLLERHISGVPVVDRDQVVGIVSESDLLWHREIGATRHRDAEPWWACMFRAQPDPGDYARRHAVCASDVMSTRLLAVEEDTPAEDIADLFHRRRIRRAPVLRGKRLVGIVTRADLVRALGLPDRQARLAGWQSDDRIRSQLLEELDAQPWWGSISNVTVAEGVVRFSGIYETEAAKRASHVAAQNIPGVRRIEDHRVGASTVSVMG